MSASVSIWFMFFALIHRINAGNGLGYVPNRQRDAAGEQRMSDYCVVLINAFDAADVYDRWIIRLLSRELARFRSAAEVSFSAPAISLRQGWQSRSSAVSTSCSH